MESPFRVLVVLANPADLPRFDDARLWSEMAAAVEPLRIRGELHFERLQNATEFALLGRLLNERWQALHLVVHGHDRSAVRYGTIALLSSDGRARNLTAAYLASQIGDLPRLKLVVLQAAAEAGGGFATVAEALVERGLTVVTAPPLSGQTLQVFVSKLYEGLVAGLNAGELARDITAAMGGERVQVHCRNLTLPIAAVSEVEAASPAPTSPPGKGLPIENHLRKELERKRAAGDFDVFLCHNWADKPAVKRIGQRLKESGILPWLDAWELPPGQPWQPLLEQQIGRIRSAAVFVGSAGLGPWQEQEMRGFLGEFAKRKLPVIPVLLADAPSTPDLPIFLSGMTWVDFRSADPDPFESLIWGITGKRPAD